MLSFWDKNRLKKAEKAFSDGDIVKLADIASSIKEDPPFQEGSRIYQLLGDAQRRARKFKDSRASYLKSIDFSEGKNTASLYGYMECCKSLKDSTSFSEALDVFLDVSKFNENLFSRLAVAAAELGDFANAKRIVGIVNPDELNSTDARTWFRLGKAMLLMDEKQAAQKYATKAKECAKGNVDLLLEIATIDYDLNEYWEMRYNSSQGERTPVPVSSQSDDAYKKRTERDVAYLESVFESVLKGKHFTLAADCGCGSGRLTYFLAKQADRLQCYDISPTAVQYAKKNNKKLKNVEFNTRNLSEAPLPEDTYDLIFDFTAVQHVSDPSLWKAVLKNYYDSCKSGGTIFLVEVIGDDKRKDVLHVSNASPATYIATMQEFGAKLVHEEVAPWREICLVFEKA